MGKYSLIILALIFVNGCGSKESEPNTQVTQSPEIKSLETNKSTMRIERTDFIPEHVRNSTIEVVPH